MGLDTLWYKNQIEAYRKEFPYYQTYADVLARVLKEACKKCAPLAIVETRAKSISSFAEKAIRKESIYPNPIQQFTDLCGARVITQTKAEVDRICQFIRENLRIDDANSPDIRARLKMTEFGYLSVHYVVQIKTPTILGIEIPSEIGERKAEIQVRTLLQHAYASITHDRVYKSEFEVPKHLNRELARVAALLEQADEAFTYATEKFDAYRLNYGVYLNPKDREKEIKTLQSILEYEPLDANKPGIALRIVRVLKAGWNWREIIEELNSVIDLDCPEKAEILMEHGAALCKFNVRQPRGEDYRRGQTEIDWAVNHGDGQIRTQALSYLAWSYGNIPGRESKARELYRQAFQNDPFNPYTLISYLEYEIYCEKNHEFVQHMRPTLLRAIEICRAHIDAGIELPWAFFAMGKFYLLLGQPYESLTAYAKAIHVCSGEEACVSEEVLNSEREFLRHINFGRELVSEHKWVDQMLLLGKSVRRDEVSPDEEIKALALRKKSFEPPVVIMGGGTDPTIQPEMEKYKDILYQALEGFKGTIISGGTGAGIPGLIGSVAETLRRNGYRDFNVIGYFPQLIPSQISEDHRYDELIRTSGKDFTPSEPLQNWIDLIAAGVKSSEVRVVGINGGQIAAFEYRLALALGATVAIIESSGRAASDLLPDVDWWEAKKLLQFPCDPKTIRVFLSPGKSTLGEEQLEKAGEAIHDEFLKENRHQSADPVMLPWVYLNEEFKESNRQQAAYAEEILRILNYGVRQSKGPVKLAEFSDSEIEIMAEIEHGRWIVERLRAGWRFGPTRDPANKISPFLKSWNELPEEAKDYDRNAVKNWPNIFARAGLEIFRLPGG